MTPGGSSVMSWNDDGVAGPELLGVALIFLLATVIQTVTGFGFALVAVPLLALVVEPVPAVVATTVASLMISAAVIRDDWEYVRWREVVVFTLSGIVGMPLGLWVLTQVPARLLTAVIAVVLLISTALVASGATLRTSRATEVGVGVTSGALLTSTGMNGPPLVVSFQAMGMPPRPFRGTLSTVFLAQGLAAVALLVAGGQVAGEALIAAAISVPMLLAGWVVGNRVFHRLDPVRFRLIVLVMLVITAASEAPVGRGPAGARSEVRSAKSEDVPCFGEH